MVKAEVRWAFVVDPIGFFWDLWPTLGSVEMKTKEFAFFRTLGFLANLM